MILAIKKGSRWSKKRWEASLRIGARKGGSRW